MSSRNEKPQPIFSDPGEAEALLMLIEASADELSQPTTVVLGLSELLLSQVDPGTPLARDLETIVKETRRVSEVIKGLKLLTH